MKIIFFSDAHGNQYTVRRFFQQIAEDKADIVVFGGDIFGYYYGQKEILSLLRRSGCICLLGNHDQFFLNLIDGQKEIDYLVCRYGITYQECMNTVNNDDIQFLRSLKSRYDLNIDGLHLSFVHGSIENPLNGRIYPDTKINNFRPYEGIDYVFMGHTHHKLVSFLANGTTLLNPGSIGQQRDGKGCTYGIFDTEKREWKVKEVFYNCEDLVSEIGKHKETKQMYIRLVEVLYRGHTL